MGSITANEWVDDFIKRHVRTRVLDGLPSKVFREALTRDVQALIDQLQDGAKYLPPAPKRRKGGENE